MKKLFLFLAMAVLLLLCGACASSTSVEGTWYSVTDATMYNFTDGEVKVSGVTVGQYEDNGDSVVISFVDGGTNMLLYVTKMDTTDVLADVKQGDGRVYFCKGLENAQKIIMDAERAEKEAEEAAQETVYTNRNDFDLYIKNNLYGVWIADNQSKNVIKMEFMEDKVIQTRKSGDEEILYITEDRLGRSFPVVVIDDGIPVLEITVSEEPDGSDAGTIFVTWQEDTFSENRVEIYSWTFTKSE